MRRHERNQIEKRPVAHTELPGQHPNARQSVVFVQRMDGETIQDLLDGVILAAMEAAGSGDGLGLHEGGAEVRLTTGEVLEAVAFGPKKAELGVGARLFAQRTNRLLATYDASGCLCLQSGVVLSRSNSEALQW